MKLSDRLDDLASRVQALAGELETLMRQLEESPNLPASILDLAESHLADKLEVAHEALAKAVRSLDAARRVQKTREA